MDKSDKKAALQGIATSVSGVLQVLSGLSDTYGQLYDGGAPSGMGRAIDALDYVRRALDTDISEL